MYEVFIMEGCRPQGLAGLLNHLQFFWCFDGMMAEWFKAVDLSYAFCLYWGNPREFEPHSCQFFLKFKLLIQRLKRLLLSVIKVSNMDLIL
jgi:hypothetical protein